MRKLFSTSLVVALILGSSLAARATTSAQLALGAATQANARCPVTLRLTGIVTGSPNLPFQYWFLNTRNGFREASGAVTAMMPVTGVAQITGSITIGASTDAGKANHVVETQNSADIKIQAFQQPPSGFWGQCFAVSAHKGGAESPLSAPFCPGRGSATQTVSLNATQQRSFVIASGDKTGLAGLGRGASSGRQTFDGLKVGYLSTATEHVLNENSRGLGFRSGLKLRLRLEGRFRRHGCFPERRVPLHVRESQT